MAQRRLHSLCSGFCASGMIALITACAGNSHPGVGVSPVVPYVEGATSCAPSPLPIVLPTVSALLDSDEVISKVRTNLANPEQAEAVFSLWFGPDGRLKSIMMLDTGGHKATPGFDDSLLVSNVHPQSPDAPWTVRTHVHLGDNPSVILDRSIYCPPKPAGLTGTETGHTQLAVTPAELEDLRHAGPFRLRILVNRDGNVIRADFVQRSGSEVQDRLLLDTARARHFKPAQLDGIAVAGWFEIRSRTQ